MMPTTKSTLQADIHTRFLALRDLEWKRRPSWFPQGDHEYDYLRKRAASEVHAERAAAHEILRQQEYQRAEDAATAARTPLNAEMRMHAYHIVDLALMDPIVTISWLKPRSASAKLVGEDNALSFTRRGTIVTPAIGTIEHVNLAEHELGHQRTGDVVGKLEGEVAAWQWVVQHALYWDWRRHEHMCKCLGTYIDGAKELRDVLGVQAIERMIAPETFQRHARPTDAAVLQEFEARLFERDHGRSTCQSGRCCAPNTLATALDAGRLVCPACALALKADRGVRMQRMWRAAMRARKAACPGS